MLVGRNEKTNIEVLVGDLTLGVFIGVVHNLKLLTK